MVRVAVSGDLDMATVAVLDSALAAAEVVAGLIVLDLRRLEFTDSSGTHLMLAADRRIREASGGRLIVICRPFEVDRLFGLLGVDRQLELVDEAQVAAIAATYTDVVAA